MKEKEKLYNSITNVSEEYIEEAQYQKSKSRIQVFINNHKVAACVCAVLLSAVLLFETAYAASETFRQTVMEFFYPLYTNDEIKAIDDGHMTGSFDEIDTLLSFLDKFNNDKLEYGLLAEKDNGYMYSLLSDSNDRIIAIVECNIEDYKLLVTMEKIAYEDTSGIWQVVSYQIVRSKEADIMFSELQIYVPEESEMNYGGSSTIIDTEGSDMVIYNAFAKENIVTLTAEERLQVQDVFSGYIPSEDITDVGLTELVIKCENVSYMFSGNGDVLVQQDGQLSYISLTENDTEILLEIFLRNNVTYSPETP